MVVQFCDTCSNLLDKSTQQFIKCDCCGESVRSILHSCLLLLDVLTKANNVTDALLNVTTTTKTNNFPSALRLKRSNIQRVSAEDTSARIARRCDNPNFDCKAEEMTYRNVQIRGADEGSTIIYKCPDCGYRLVVPSALLPSPSGPELIMD